jgi:hypothetical protein
MSQSVEITSRKNSLPHNITPKGHQPPYRNRYTQGSALPCRHLLLNSQPVFYTATITPKTHDRSAMVTVAVPGALEEVDPLEDIS